MAYNKQTWANGQAGGTPINATRLNHIEDGISDVDERVTHIEQEGTASAIKDLKDVSLEGLTDGQILEYDETSEKWKNTTIKIKSIDDIATITNQLANINYLLNQSIAENYTDSTEAYTKQISDGTSPFGRLDMLGGKTFGYNQKIDENSKDFTNSVTDTRTVFIMHMFVGDTLGLQTNLIYGKNEVPTGKLTDIITPSASGKFLRVKHNGSSADIVICDTSCEIIKDHKYYLKMDIVGNNPQVRSGIVINNFNLIDLTKMFGSGKEPTLEQCRQIFTEDYYPYSKGQLVNIELTEIISKGANRDIATYPTSAIIKKYFSDGMKSAGSVYDELNLLKGKAIKRIADDYSVLATPIETDIEPSDIEALKTLEVEANGTITMENEFHLSIPSQQTYQRIRQASALFDDGIVAESEDAE